MSECKKGYELWNLFNVINVKAYLINLKQLSSLKQYHIAIINSFTLSNFKDGVTLSVGDWHLVGLS